MKGITQLFSIACLFIASFSFAQSSESLSLFLDAKFEQDDNFIRQRLNYIEYAVNRQTADLYLQMARQSTGKGGEKYDLMLAGVSRWENQTDTLHFFTEPQASEKQKQDLIVEHIGKILLPYLLQTSLRDKIAFELESDNTTENTTPETDKWNSWVFNLGGLMIFQGESSYRSSEFGLKATASRVTEKSKFYLSNRFNYEKNTFILDEETEISNLKRSYSTYSRYVHSIAPHWSIGASASINSSTFDNYDWRVRFQPGIEYSLFPYEESATQQFSFFYKIGPIHNDYTETTILGKDKETVLQHGLDAVYRIYRDWGELSVHLFSSQYLHEPDYYSLTFGPVLNWNLSKGLTLEVAGYLTHTGDRINVPQTEISTEDLLLQTRLVDSSFDYFSYIGVNYRFGSKNNSVVNPRFDGYDLDISINF